MGHWVEGQYYKTLRKVAAKYGLTPEALTRRMKRHNLTAEEAVIDFKPSYVSRKIVFNNVEYDSITDLERTLDLPDNILQRYIDQRGYPVELAVYVIQTGYKHTDLYFYDNAIYVSKKHLCDSYEIDVNAVSAAQHYHECDFITAFEMKLGGKEDGSIQSENTHQ